jgi:hypothetical protein
VTTLFVRHTPACFSAGIAFYVAVAAQPQNRRVRFPRDTLGLGSFLDADSVLAPLIGPTVFDLVEIGPV